MNFVPHPKLHWYESPLSLSHIQHKYAHANINRSDIGVVYIFTWQSHTAVQFSLSPSRDDCVRWLSMGCDVPEFRWLEPEWICSHSYIHTTFIPSFRSNSCWYMRTRCQSPLLARSFYLPPSVRPFSLPLSVSISLQFWVYHSTLCIKPWFLSQRSNIANEFPPTSNKQHILPFFSLQYSRRFVHSQRAVGTSEAHCRTKQNCLRWLSMYCYAMWQPEYRWIVDAYEDWAYILYEIARSLSLNLYIYVCTRGIHILHIWQREITSIFNRILVLSSMAL